VAIKVFEGGEYPVLLQETHRHFDFVKGLKPEATREVSREMFIIGHRYKGPPQTKSRIVAAKDRHLVAPKRPTPGANWGGARGGAGGGKPA